MEEVYNFVKLLRKFKYALIAVPVLSVIITFFLLTNLPDSYVSQAQISTGIVDETQRSLLSATNMSKNTEVNQEFSNLIEMIKMKKVLDQVSYRLFIHDVTSKKPFRKVEESLKGIDTSAALAIIRSKYNNTEGLNLWIKEQSDLYNVIQDTKYDGESLKKKLMVYRSNESDFIILDFESENPELSAFVANALSEEFIKYYTFLVKVNQKKANNFLKDLLVEKKTAMDEKVAILRDYKIANRVLNLNEQSRQLYEQTLSYNSRKQQAVESIASKAGALNEIERKFTSKERGYIESTLTKVNVDIMATTEELKALNDMYVRNDFEPRYKASIDSLNTILSAQINRSTDEYIYNPLVSKQELVQKKLDLAIQLDLAKYSMASIEKEQDKLNAQFDKLVPYEAGVQSLNMELDIASKEYLDVLGKYNQSSLESVFSIKLNFIQQAIPGLPKPSKKMLLVILSGIISFSFCLFILFVIFLADNSIGNPKDLADKTQLPVLGSLIEMPGSVNMERIWGADIPDVSVIDFKNQLRSLRFEIGRELKGADKVLVLTSLNEAEGKSFLALSLAYAWKVTKQKVLIIDGNFHNPKISKSLTHKIYLEDYLNDKISIEDQLNSEQFTVLSNKGGDTSLLEIATESVIREKIEKLKTFYDFIIVEAGALDKFNLGKEWMIFGDKILGVFESGKSITASKKASINYLSTLDHKFIGWVLNKIVSNKSQK